jgi:hypothetical protein
MQIEEGGMQTLENLVAATTTAIRSGHLSQMGDLAAKTEAALAELGPQDDNARLIALRETAARNVEALAAAARGVRAARRRLAEVTAIRKGVQTYDIAGNTQKIGGPDGAMKARF